MNVEDILHVLQERGARLYVNGGRLKYAGPRRPENDPLREAITVRRDELLLLYSAPVPAIRPVGWSNRLEREVYEPGGHPGTWVETDDSAKRCIWCPDVLAEGDRLGCARHRTPLLVTAPAERDAVSVVQGPPTERDGLRPGAESGERLEGAA